MLSGIEIVDNKGVKTEIIDAVVEGLQMKFSLNITAHTLLNFYWLKPETWRKDSACNCGFD